MPRESCFLNGDAVGQAMEASMPVIEAAAVDSSRRLLPRRTGEADAISALRGGKEGKP